jgi:FkbM family methyltransferase
MIEFMSRGRVVKRHMPSRFGGDPIYITPDAALRYWKRNLDSCAKELFDWAAEFVRPGHIVWDIGASMGLFSFAAASITGPAGSVLAVEPDLVSVGLLRRSALSRSKERGAVEIVPAAVDGTIGIEDFHVARRGRSSSFLHSSKGSSQAGGIRETVQVVTVTLDWLLERRRAPDVLKIDVEGSELAILGGSSLVLEKARPTILCEVRCEYSESVTSILQENSYKLYDLNDRAKGETERASPNTLALPEEMACKVT